MWFVGTVAAFGIAAFLHAIVVRLPRRDATVALFVVAGGGVGMIWLALVAARYGLTVPLAAASLMFAFLCELYIFAFTLVANSVALSLLLTVRGGCTSVALLEEMYRPEAMVRRRLEQLERSAIIERSAARLTLTVAGHRLVRIFTLVTAPMRPTLG